MIDVADVLSLCSSLMHLPDRLYTMKMLPILETMQEFIEPVRCVVVTAIVTK